MSRPKFIQKLIDQGKTEEEIIEMILQGSKDEGVAPVTGDNAKTFAKLHYKKVLKKLK